MPWEGGWGEDGVLWKRGWQKVGVPQEGDGRQGALPWEGSGRGEPWKAWAELFWSSQSTSEPLKGGVIDSECSGGAELSLVRITLNRTEPNFIGLHTLNDSSR